MKLEKFDIAFLVGLIISTIIMIWILIFGVLSLNVSFLIFFYVIKFLAGFGLVLSIANVSLIILDKSKETIGKRGVNFLIIFQIIVPIIIIIYASYRIYSSYYGKGGITMSGVWADVYVLLDNLIYIYGIASLLIQLYIIPLAREQFEEAINKGRIKKFKSGAKKMGRGIKKKYFSWRKKYAKAQIQDQKNIKELLEDSRNKLAVFFLVILAIGSLIITPIAFILIIIWLNIFFFSKTNTHTYEKISLLISIIIIGLIAVIIPFVSLGIYEGIEEYLWTINIFYLIGICLASFIFIKKLLNLEGITINSIKKNYMKRKKEKLKQTIAKQKRKLKNKDIKPSKENAKNNKKKISDK
ncbi:MAG: hypothetical protein ACTSQJ_04515 [Promethearchaeota archaeon]